MSEIDIVPEMLEEIQQEFKRLFQKDPTVKRVYKKIQNNAVDYEEANAFAIRLGEMLSEALRKYVTVDNLPEGRFWYNMASRIMNPTLSTNYNLIADVCRYAQETVNTKGGIALKVLTPALNQNKIDGFVDKLSNAEQFEDVEWMLGEPVVNFSQSVVDDSIRDNMDFHVGAGLSPKIIRTLGANETRTAVRGKGRVKYQIPCKWCESLAGVYDYRDMPDYIADNIFRRHEYCRCTVEYVEAGKKQDVWSKKVYDIGKDDRIRYSKALNRDTEKERQDRIEKSGN